MPEPASRTSQRLSRQVIQLMLEMNRLLRHHGISIALTGPHVYEEIVRASETVDNAELAQLRQHLMAAVTATPAMAPIEVIPETPALQPPVVPEPVRMGEPAQATAAAPQPVPFPDPATAGPPSMPVARARALPTVRTVYPHDLQSQPLICHQCGNTVALLAAHVAADNPMPLQCGCGASFKIGEESRKYRRKRVELPGRYVLLKSGETGFVVVENLSFGGMRFRTHGDSNIQYNDELKIDFKLNPQSRLIISVQAKARFVSLQAVGVEFVPTDAFNPQLALYLMQ